MLAVSRGAWLEHGLERGEFSSNRIPILQVYPVQKSSKAGRIPTIQFGHTTHTTGMSMFAQRVVVSRVASHLSKFRLIANASKIRMIGGNLVGLPSAWSVQLAEEVGSPQHGSFAVISNSAFAVELPGHSRRLCPKGSFVNQRQDGSDLRARCLRIGGQFDALRATQVSRKRPPVCR